MPVGQRIVIKREVFTRFGIKGFRSGRVLTIFKDGVDVAPSADPVRTIHVKWTEVESA